MNNAQKEAEKFALETIIEVIRAGHESHYYYNQTHAPYKRGFLLTLASGYVIVDHTHTKIGSDHHSDSITYHLYPALKSLWGKNINNAMIRYHIEKSISSFRNIPLKPKSFGIVFP